jgi:hypothetical protein
MTKLSKEIELAALNKSIALWAPLITELQALDEFELSELDEFGIQGLKEDIDINVITQLWYCYLCNAFWDTSFHVVDCESCCVGIACGPCKDDDGNDYKILVNQDESRIKRLRAANRILRAMKARRKQLQSEVQG